MTNNQNMPSAALPMTITVRALRAQHEGAEVLVQVLLESGERREQKSLPLTIEQYYELKLQKGLISEEQYDRIEAASQFCQALRSGESLLSYGSNSVRLLSRKLEQRGYSREIAQAAAKHLEALGLINEASDLRREVEKCVRKFWGEKRIRAHVWNRGFAAEALAELPQLLEQIDFAANCAALIQKKYGAVPDDRDEFRRMTASLARYGYSIAEIRAAVQILNP